MSDKDIKLIWEAYEREYGLDREPEGFARIQNEWEHDILPRLETVGQTDLDYTTKPDGGLVIFFPSLHLTYEQGIDMDMFSRNQVARLKQEFDATFGKYNFIKFEVEHATDNAVEDPLSSEEGQWMGINVYIDQIEVSEEHIEEYFKLLLAVDHKAKELSRG